MARSVTIPSAQYQGGGPPIIINLDDFPGNYNELKVTVTREPAGVWPGTNADEVMSISMKWNDGSGQDVGLPGGTLLDRFTSAVVLQHTPTVQVPRVGQGKKNLVGGTVTITVHQTLTTTISAEVRV